MIGVVALPEHLRQAPLVARVWIWSLRHPESRWQVRERVYTRSVARWRNYCAHLPQLIGAF